MIKTTKTMLSKAWAIVSAFKPEEALHNDRLNKIIDAEQALVQDPFELVLLMLKSTEPTRLVQEISHGQFHPDIWITRAFEILKHKGITVMPAGGLSKLLSQKGFIESLQEDTSIGFETKNGGAK